MRPCMMMMAYHQVIVQPHEIDVERAIILRLEHDWAFKFITQVLQSTVVLSDAFIHRHCGLGNYADGYVENVHIFKNLQCICNV